MRIDEATLIHTFAAGVSDISAGRLGAIVAGVVGLIGIVIGGRALVRSASRSRSAGRTGMMLGLVAMVLGGLIMATADGGLGSGNGLGGAVVAAVLGLVATILGWLARTRTAT